MISHRLPHLNLELPMTVHANKYMGKNFQAPSKNVELWDNTVAAELCDRPGIRLFC